MPCREYAAASAASHRGVRFRTPSSAVARHESSFQPMRSARATPRQAAELARWHECFFGADRAYHEARRRFVYKLGPACAVTGPAAAQQAPPAPAQFRAVVGGP